MDLTFLSTTRSEIISFKTNLKLLEFKMDLTFLSTTRSEIISFKTNLKLFEFKTQI